MHQYVCLYDRQCLLHNLIYVVGLICQQFSLEDKQWLNMESQLLFLRDLEFQFHIRICSPLCVLFSYLPSLYLHVQDGVSCEGGIKQLDINGWIYFLVLQVMG